MSKMILKKMALLAGVGMLMLSGAIRMIAAEAPPAAGATTATMEEPGAKAFTLVSVEVNDVKFWLPSTITVDQGDKVKLTLKNQVPGSTNQHGYTIPGYNITEVVTRGTPKTITFVADKAGVFPYSCQLHPAHVGGQLVVNPKK